MKNQVKKQRIRKTTHAVEPYVAQEDVGISRQCKCWETFFYEQRSPVLRSQMLTVLMAGTQLEAERVPKASLLDALLMAYAARHYCAAEIVDDFQVLVDRVKEEWDRPTWTTKVFSSAHANAAAFIVYRGSRNLDDCEHQYFLRMMEWYLGHDCPSYFDEELTEVPARMLLRGSGKLPIPGKKRLRPEKEDLLLSKHGPSKLAPLSKAIGKLAKKRSVKK